MFVIQSIVDYNDDVDDTPNSIVGGKGYGQIVHYIY